MHHLHRTSLFAATLAVALPLSVFAGVSESPKVASPGVSLPRPVMLLDKGDKPAKSDNRSEAERRDDALHTIAEAADRIVSPEGFSSVLDLVASTDRNRIESGIKKADTKAIAESAKEFNKIWHDKFRTNFDATKHFDLINGMRVELRDNDAGDREYAFIYFPAFGGWKPFEMHLTRVKGAAWRIQLPDNLSAEKLVKETAHDVQKLVDDKNRWFDDEHINYNSAVTQLVHAMAFPSGGDRKEDKENRR